MCSRGSAANPPPPHHVGEGDVQPRELRVGQALSAEPLRRAAGHGLQSAAGCAAQAAGGPARQPLPGRRAVPRRRHAPAGYWDGYVRYSLKTRWTISGSDD